MVDFFNSQLRNALALSIFLLGYSYVTKKIKYSLFLISGAIHLGLLLLIGAYFLIEFLNKRVKTKGIRLSVLIVFSGFAAYGYKMLFALLNDLRAEIYSGSSGMSVIYFIWGIALVVCFVIMEFEKKEVNTSLDLAFVGSLLVVMAYFSGGYYTRYLAMFFPFMLLAIGEFNVRKPVVWVMSFYCLYTFVMNFIVA